MKSGGVYNWLLSCSTYDGDEEEVMSAEVTHIVAEVEDGVHTQVSGETSDAQISPCFLTDILLVP